MVLHGDTEEMKNVDFRVIGQFNFTYDIIVDAENELEKLVVFCNQPFVKSMLVENITYEDYCSILDEIETHCNVLDLCKNYLETALEGFKNIRSVSAGAVSERFLEITEKVLGHFVSIQIKTEISMNEVQELSKIVRNLARTYAR